MTKTAMLLPPRMGFVMLAIFACIWSQQHPTSALADSTWILPVDTPAHLVGKYRAPATEYAVGHRGIDYQVHEGQTILAPSNGEVYFAGQVANKPVVSMIHGQGYITSFEPACTKFKKGQKLTRGQLLAIVCPMGYKSHCPSLCLHYGLRLGGAYLSPLALAGALAPSHTVRQARG